MPAKPSQSHAPQQSKVEKKKEVVLFDLGPRRLYHLLRGSTHQLRTTKRFWLDANRRWHPVLDRWHDFLWCKPPDYREVTSGRIAYSYAADKSLSYNDGWGLRLLHDCER